MRRLLLLRHAKAVPFQGRDDFERELTERGRDDARRLAAHVVEQNVAPERIFHSSAMRTTETASIIAAGLPQRPALEPRADYYDAIREALLLSVRELPNTLRSAMLVGHNPGIADLARWLIGSGPHRDIKALAAKFPTSSLAVLEFDVAAWRDVERSSGLLSLYATPSMLGGEDV